MLRIERYANREISEVELRDLLKLILPFDLRRRSRLRTKLANGTEAALFMPRGSVLRDGDLLEAEDGTVIKVESAREDVLFVTAETPYALMRAAYHLGNRHTPVELGENFLKLAHTGSIKFLDTRIGSGAGRRLAPGRKSPPISAN